jgi:putative acetyltransferase
MKLIQVESADEIDRARELFKEYAAGLGIDLCFQHFDKELALLPGDYVPSTGRLFLAMEADNCSWLRGLTLDCGQHL